MGKGKGKKRFESACNAMEAIGIALEAVKPVLKNLLDLYDQKWEFIEVENYRVLADAIFEHRGDATFEGKYDKGVSEKKEKSEDSERFVSQSKNLLLEAEVIEASSIPNSVSTMTVPIEDSSPQISEPALPEEQSCLSSRQHGENNILQIPKLPSFGKTKGQRSTVASNAGKQPFKKLPAPGSSKMPADEVGPVRLRSSKDHAHLSNLKLNEVKTIDHGEGSSKFSANISKISTGLVDGSSSSPGSRNNKIDIASSPFGDIKLSVYGVSSLTSPTVDAVLKSVEENFLTSQKAAEPSISLKKLLEGLCQSFAKVDTEATDRCFIRKSPRTGTTQNGLECNIGSPQRPQKLRKLEGVTNEMNEGDPALPCLKGAGKKHRIYVKDITKGEEKFEIPLVVESGKGVRPKFFYIRRNLIHQNAHVNISLARISNDDSCASCKGNCLSHPVPCACARETRGEYAYTVNGLLKHEFLKLCMSMMYAPEKHSLVYCQEDCPKERVMNEKRPDPCKGHLVRKFIKECWSKCGCDLKCGNRVVQRGISHKLQVFWTNKAKGWGLQTTEELPEGAFVCEYVGEILTNTELHERNKQQTGKEMHTYPVLLDADWASESILKDEDLLCLDATYYGNVARFINHRCGDANLIEIPIEIETTDHHYYHLAFFTSRKVEANEELSWDYGIDFHDDKHPIKAFRCTCGSELCRDTSPKDRFKFLGFWLSNCDGGFLASSNFWFKRRFELKVYGSSIIKHNVIELMRMPRSKK